MAIFKMLSVKKQSISRGLHICKPLILLFVCSLFSFSPIFSQSPLQQEIDSLIEEGEAEQANLLLNQLAQDKTLAPWISHRKALLENIYENYDAALSILDSLESIIPLSLSPNDKLIGEIYKAKAENYMSTGEFELSIDFFNQSIQHNTKIKNWKDICYAYAGLSIIANATEAWSDMESHLNQAEQIAQKNLSPNDDFFSILYSLFAVLYDANGDFEKALKYAQDGIDYQKNKGLQNANDTIWYAYDLNNLANVLASMEEFDQALLFYKQSFQLETTVTDPSIEWATSYLNIIFCYMELSNWDQALFYVNEVNSFLTDFPEKSVINERYQAANHKAVIYAEQGKYAEAIKIALRTSKEASPRQQKTAKLILAEANLLMGQYSKCIDILQQLNIDEGFRMKELSFYYRNLALAYGYSKDFEKAENVFDILEKVLLPNDQSNSSPMHGEYLKFLWAKADISFHQFANDKNNTQALMASNTYYQEAANVINDIQNNFSSRKDKQYLLKETRSRFEQSIQVAHQLFEITQEPKYLLTAFQFADQAKTVLLQQRMQSKAIKDQASIPKPLLEEEQLLKRRLTFYEKKFFEEKLGKEQDALKLSKWEEKIHKTNTALQDLDKRLAPFLKDKEEGFSSFGLEQIELLKKEGISLINYFWGEQQLYIFQIKDAISLSIMPINKAFKSDLAQLVQLIHEVPNTNLESSYQQYISLSNKLYESLIPNPGSLQQRLVIIPDGWLSQLPFEILLTQKPKFENIRYDQLDYLLKKTSIFYLYSTAFLNEPSPPKDILRCLAMAPFSISEQAFEGEFSELRSASISLPGTQKELIGLASHFDGNFQFGKGATESYFKKNAEQYELLHLAMHAKANLNDPMFGQMYFSISNGTDENDTLFSQELKNINLKAELAVLSACETGLGLSLEGNGIVSIASHFFEAGCKSVTMSLWEAQDDATSQIMQDYYNYLSEGQSKDQALRTAKLKYLESPFHQQHLFFWAGFVHLGDPAPIVSQHSINWLFWVVGISLLMLVGFLFIRAKK